MIKAELDIVMASGNNNVEFIIGKGQGQLVKVQSKYVFRELLEFFKFKTGKYIIIEKANPPAAATNRNIEMRTFNEYFSIAFRHVILFKGATNQFLI